MALLAALGEGQSDTRLAFGCETADLDGLTAAAALLDTPEVQSRIKAGMGEGLAYGAACQAALDAEGELGALLKTPNNLLGIAYLRAIRRLGVDITALPVMRRGVDHDSQTPIEGYASATHLRGLLHAPSSDVPWPYMPSVAAEIFQRELAQGRGPASLEQLEATVLTLLRLRKPPEGGYLDDSEGLSIRIAAVAARVGSLCELLEQAKTKRYHLSRIRRLVLAMCLGLRPAHRPQIPPYLRVLAANQTGMALLRGAAKTASLPILSRPGGVKHLGPAAEEIMAKEAAVTDLMALCFEGPARIGGGEWRTVPYVVGEEGAVRGRIYKDWMT